MFGRAYPHARARKVGYYLYTMDDQLIRDGSTFISTSLAAELTGYTRDYVGQLAREGYFHSIKVGRNRFVDRVEFFTYANEHRDSFDIDDLPENHVTTELKKVVMPDSDDQEYSQAQEEGDQGEGDTEEVEGREVPISTSRGGVEESEGSEQKTETGESHEAGEKKVVWNLPIAPSAKENNFGFSHENTSSAFRESSRQQPSSSEVDPERMSSRWRLTRDGWRRAGSSVPPQEDHKRRRLTTAALSLLLAAAIGLAGFGTSTLETPVERMAEVTERTYHDIGVGLNEKLKHQSPVEVVVASVSETSGMIAQEADRTADRFSEHMQSSGQSGGQVAAVGAVGSDGFFSWLGGRITQAFGFLGDEISRRLAWLADTQESSTSVYEDVPSVRFADNQASDGSTVESVRSAEESQVQKESPDDAVVVPAPTSTQAQGEMEQRVRDQFSDPVEVKSTSSRSGVIQPEFREADGDEYLYIMVPEVQESTGSNNDESSAVHRE